MRVEKVPGQKSTITIHSSNRHGGVSASPFHSFNLSYGVGDSREAVDHNRQILKNNLGVEVLLSAKQVHGDSVFVVDSAMDMDMEVDSCDALMTDIPGIALMIQQADCQAITLFDPVRKAISAIHCGWKGSVIDIVSKTILKMSSRYGSQPSDLCAHISPSLGPCCAEFVHHEEELPGSFLAFQVKENYFDFWKISEMQLMKAGLQKMNITCSGLCTSCSDDYFSYRRACREADGRTGRFSTTIVLH